MNHIQKASTALGIIVLGVMLTGGVLAALTVGVILAPIMAFAIGIWYISRSGHNWGGQRPSDQVPLSKMFRK